MIFQNTTSQLPLGAPIRQYCFSSLRGLSEPMPTVDRRAVRALMPDVEMSHAAFWKRP